MARLYWFLPGYLFLAFALWNITIIIKPIHANEYIICDCRFLIVVSRPRIKKSKRVHKTGFAFLVWLQVRKTLINMQDSKSKMRSWTIASTFTQWECVPVDCASHDIRTCWMVEKKKSIAYDLIDSVGGEEDRWNSTIHTVFALYRRKRESKIDCFTISWARHTRTVRI